MNVLILTPDAVGGTFMEIMLTVYMQFHSFNKPVVEFHDLVLGVEEYYSPELKKMLLRSIDDPGQGYQNLNDITNLLKQADFYKVAKLTHYMSIRRQDSIKDQTAFYRYLNDNFYIISCRRNNVFEHALSWSINKITGALNVYSIDHKINSLFLLYRDGGIRIDPLSLQQSLESYKKYLKWVEDNFSVASYYIYEKDSTDIEKFILSLPIFKGQQTKVSWKDVFGITASDWNKCHYLTSDFSSLAQQYNIDQGNRIPDHGKLEKLVLENVAQFTKKYNDVKGEDWPNIDSVADYENLPQSIKNECDEFGITYFLDQLYICKNAIEGQYQMPVKKNMVPLKEKLITAISDQHKDFLSQHRENYNKASQSIQQLVSTGIINKTVPIKKQTLKDKMLMVQNIEECLEVYNIWANNNSEICQPIDIEKLTHDATNEYNKWTSSNLLVNKD